MIDAVLHQRLQNHSRHRDIRYALLNLLYEMNFTGETDVDNIDIVVHQADLLGKSRNTVFFRTLYR